MWIYFILAIYLIAIVRLVFLFSSGGDNVIQTFTQWMITLIIVSISWFILGKMWGFDASLNIGNNSSIQFENKETEGTEIIIKPEE